MMLFLGAVPIILKLFSKARGHLLFSNYSWNNLPKPTSCCIKIGMLDMEHYFTGKCSSSHYTLKMYGVSRFTGTWNGGMVE